MKRRDQIAMSEGEVADFLDEQRVVVLGTLGSRGWPHLVALWYVVRDGEVWAWSYAKAQKVRNLEREPRATLQIEDGDEYAELRGVMIETRVVIHRDPDVVAALGAEIFRRYGSDALGDEFMEVVRAQAAKRVALQFIPVRVVSWDHRKLQGAY